MTPFTDKGCVLAIVWRCENDGFCYRALGCLKKQQIRSFLNDSALIDPKASLNTKIGTLRLHVFAHEQ